MRGRDVLPSSTEKELISQPVLAFSSFKSSIPSDDQDVPAWSSGPRKRSGSSRLLLFIGMLYKLNGSGLKDVKVKLILSGVHMGKKLAYSNVSCVGAPFGKSRTQILKVPLSNFVKAMRRPSGEILGSTYACAGNGSDSTSSPRWLTQVNWRRANHSPP